MNAMLVAARAVHFASAILLFGELAFILFVARPAWRSASRALLGGDDDIYRRLLWVGGLSLATSIVSGLIWLAAEAAAMSGTPLPQAISRDTLGLVLGETVFGRLWILRFGLAIALGVLLMATARSDDDEHKRRIAMGALVIAAAYLAALAWAGHAAAGREPERDIQLFSDVIHLFAAGAWLGALPGLVWWLGGTQPLDAAAQATRRFSTLGAICVGALVTTGLINAWYLVGDVPALFGTEYGRLLLAKLALFAAMLVIAVPNRWYLTPRVASNDRLALNLLRRNAILEIAAGTVVVMIIGALGVTIPGAHQPPVWPFDHTLSWLPAERSAWVGAIVAAAGTLACVAAGVTLEGARRRRPPLWIAGLTCIAASAAICAWLLAVPAYPTTYLASPVPFATDSIVRGSVLYDRSCSACHGAHGHGDGPVATSLPIKPSDLAEHASRHHPGDLFWWIAHGIPETPMPGFAPRLSDSEIWDLVQFLRAQAQAQQAVALTSRVEPRLAVEAPDFTFEIAGKAQASLRQRAANGVTLLVLYTLPESLPRLQALASAEPVFAAARARIVAVPRGKSSSLTATVLAGESIFATTGPSVAAVYAMFARPSRDTGDGGSEHAEFLIDARGYLRARWIGVPAATTDRMVEILSQIKLLNDERLRAPASEEHAH